jgi:hypothetical protein
VIEFVYQHVLPAAGDLLPDEMQSHNADALLLTIGLYESGFTARRQKPLGPARSFWQFEDAGVLGVLSHPATRTHAHAVLSQLQYSLNSSVHQIQVAMEHNDVLAAAFARLNLWWDPERLPGERHPMVGWEIYKRVWRPGAPPRLDAWAFHWSQAWAIVNRDPFTS